MTLSAPALRCFEASSLVRKMPVHSSTMSAPRSFQGSLAGSLSALTGITSSPTTRAPSLVDTARSNLPWTESHSSKWASMSASVRSLIPTISISLLGFDMMTLATHRPMRPKPLIPIFLLIVPATLTFGHSTVKQQRFQVFKRRKQPTCNGLITAQSTLLGGFSVFTQIVGYQLKDFVGERNDIGAAVATVLELSVHRFGEDLQTP